jgi:hypothetical protein
LAAKLENGEHLIGKLIGKLFKKIIKMHIVGSQHRLGPVLLLEHLIGKLNVGTKASRRRQPKPSKEMGLWSKMFFCHMSSSEKKSYL